MYVLSISCKLRRENFIVPRRITSTRSGFYIQGEALACQNKVPMGQTKETSQVDQPNNQKRDQAGADNSSNRMEWRVKIFVEGHYG